VGDDADAEATRAAPYQPVAGQQFWLRYIEGSPPIILGIYNSEDDTPGVSSLPVPATWLTKGAKRMTDFLEALDDLLPGLGDVMGTPW
jgi:hypothetical protein